MLSNDSKGSVVFKRVHKFSSRNDSVIPFCVFAWVHGKLFYLPWIVVIFINEILTQMKGRGSSEIQCMVKHSPAQISQWGKLLFWHGYLLSVFFPVLNNFCEDAMPSLEIDLSVFVCILLYNTWYCFLSCIQPKPSANISTDTEWKSNTTHWYACEEALPKLIVSSAKAWSSGWSKQVGVKVLAWRGDKGTTQCK